MAVSDFVLEVPVIDYSSLSDSIARCCLVKPAPIELPLKQLKPSAQVHRDSKDAYYDGYEDGYEDGSNRSRNESFSPESRKAPYYTYYCKGYSEGYHDGYMDTVEDYAIDGFEDDDDGDWEEEDW